LTSLYGKPVLLTSRFRILAYDTNPSCMKFATHIVEVLMGPGTHILCDGGCILITCLRHPGRQQCLQPCVCRQELLLALRRTVWAGIRCCCLCAVSLHEMSCTGIKKQLHLVQRGSAVMAWRDQQRLLLLEL